ncbi:PucR C-terminal helix-turn-helix domain-containing protein [Quadrisphaera granulorum]|uniref:PucR-like helix-turn-helix protein n=1 Tax=Quadrisphaera granulorum TaxID=317664 RepID=A0A315ZS69_9ACTN|nr:helix-turn-helix domain-containing protein [Quadrisphaera granulorum]PWJ48142.1 PucR-like helix-turn-helix protein [Quadrisphaera granulorum]SZE98511.1 PucR C-terminal helix-turn-helix domain-containing protein [Quadrisphaera granulorum]
MSTAEGQDEGHDEGESRGDDGAVLAAARREEVARALQGAAGALAATAMARLEEHQPWYAALGPQERSWVGLVAQGGIASFVAWFRAPEARRVVSADVFAVAPRELVRAVSLHQALQLLRVVVDVVEEQVPRFAEPDHRADYRAELREAVLRYSREVAFSAAEVYARAAEARGAWDARLEALVVDALVRGEADDDLATRVAALGWAQDVPVAVLIGTRPAGAADVVVADLRRAARAAADDALVGLRGDRALVVLGAAGQDGPLRAANALAPRLGAGPVVVGPVVAGLAAAGRSARTALVALTAARAWPEAPRPVAADELLPERVLAGDAGARRALADRVHAPLVAAAPVLADTLRAYLASGRSLEGTARALFVHPNTVRYRLRRVAEVTGWDPTVPREAFVLQVGLAVGALAERPGRRTTAPSEPPTT